MSKSLKWMLGFAALSGLGFAWMMGLSGGPTASRERPIALPDPAQLGQAVPGSPTVAVPDAQAAKEEARPRSMGFPKPHKADKLTAPAEVVKQMEKEGQVVY